MGDFIMKNKIILQSTSLNKVILLRNLPYGLYINQLYYYLSQYGNIFKIWFLYSKQSGTSKRRAFIEFEWASVAEIVSVHLDCYILHENRLFCRQLTVKKFSKK